MAVQNVWQHHFLHPRALSDVGETVAHMWSQVVETAALQEFHKYYKFLRAPPPQFGTYVAQIL
jgi:hypothetical protein